MSRKLALFLSVVFQPLVMPSMVFAFLLFGIPESTREYATSKPLIFLAIVLTTFIVPLISLWTMRMTNMIKSFKLESREERLLPFSMISLFYMITTYFFYLKLAVDPTLVFTLAVITSSIVLLTSISFFWKISAHMTGVSGLLAIIVACSFRYPSFNLLYPLLGCLLLAGAVASSRLFLNAHTPAEILGGFVLGFSVCFSAFYYILF